MDEIDGDDLKRFKVYLRSLKTSIGKNIDRRTVYNHFLNTVSFLNTSLLLGTEALRAVARDGIRRYCCSSREG